MKIFIEMKCLPADQPAASGDIIPRRVLESYINSDECKERVSKGLVSGGVTHHSRKASKEGIPNADEILLSSNNFFHATNLWMDGNFACGRFKVYTDLKLEGDIANVYNSFINGLKNGVKYPVSSCLRSYWDDAVCREIVFLRGVDLTLQPSFAGSEITKIEIYDDNDKLILSY